MAQQGADAVPAAASAALQLAWSAIAQKFGVIGGKEILGCPIAPVQRGQASFRATVGLFQTFQNGAIEYYDSQADNNPDGNPAGSAFVILRPMFNRWALPICRGDEPAAEIVAGCPNSKFAAGALGYPTGHVSDEQPPSSQGTKFRFQNFEGGALELHVSSNRNLKGRVFEAHGAIFAKWSALGFAAHPLGLPTSDERDALPSPFGTTGRVGDFENGHIHFHRTGPRAGQSFETHGEIDKAYLAIQPIGGTVTCLGFPISDIFGIPGGERANFEGGFIEWNPTTGAKATCGVSPPPPDLTITKTASPNPVTSGRTLTYTITVQNVGTGAASSATVTDTLPANVTFQSCSAPSCTPSGNIVTASLGPIAAAASTSFSIVVTAPTVTIATPITNTASVSTAGDSNPANNQTSQATTVSPPAPPPPPVIQQGGGPPAGTIYSIAIDPSNSAVVYIGTLGGGIFKSTNGGQNWAGIHPGIQTQFLLAIDPQSTLTVYAAYSGGVIKTTNGGVNWASASSGLGSSYVLSLAIDPANTSQLYVGTIGRAFGMPAVFRSSDGGQNWTASDGGLPNTYVWSLAVDRQNPAVVYAGTDNGLFRSINGGQTWTAYGSGLPNTTVQSLTIDPSTPTTLYAPTYAGLYKSVDSGANWTPSLLQFVQAVATSGRNSVFAATYDRGIFKTLDGGQNWVTSNSGLTSSSVFSLAIDPANSASVYAGTWGGGVFKSSTAGQSWTPVNSGLSAASVSSLDIDSGHNTVIFAGTWGGGIFRSADGGQNWTPVNSGLTDAVHQTANTLHQTVSSVVVEPSSAAIVYAAINGDFGGCFKSIDGGQTWNRLFYGYARSLALDPGPPTTIYTATEKGVLRSTDAGQTWSAVNSGLSTLAVTSLVIDSTATTTIYAGTVDGVFKSTDGGQNWTAANAGLPSTSVSSLVINPGTTLYAGTNVGVFRSTNSGQSWTSVNSGLTNTSIRLLAVDRINSGIVYAGTGGGLFKSMNSGQSWVPVNSGLIDPFHLQSLATDPAVSGVVYVGTDGQGIFKTVNGGATWQPTGAN